MICCRQVVDADTLLGAENPCHGTCAYIISLASTVSTALRRHASISIPSCASSPFSSSSFFNLRNSFTIHGLFSRALAKFGPNVDVMSSHDRVGTSWASCDSGRVGVAVFSTGRQHLEDSMVVAEDEEDEKDEEDEREKEDKEKEDKDVVVVMFAARRDDDRYDGGTHQTRPSRFRIGIHPRHEIVHPSQSITHLAPKRRLDRLRT
jgi:hypothetical protein